MRSNGLRNAIGLGGVDLLASTLDSLEHFLEREGCWSICGLVGVLQGVNLSSLGVKIDFEVTSGCKRTFVTTCFSSGGQSSGKFPTFFRVLWVAKISEVGSLQDPCDCTAAAAAGHGHIELINVLVVAFGHFQDVGLEIYEGQFRLFRKRVALFAFSQY
jgi:hypothetical protein